MGCYVNPPDMTKEAWLAQNGERTDGPCEVTETHLPVCLVHNGAFTAAGVCYCTQERDEFNSPSDYRPKLWFKVHRADLRRVSDLARYEAREARP